MEKMLKNVLKIASMLMMSATIYLADTMLVSPKSAEAYTTVTRSCSLYNNGTGVTLSARGKIEHVNKGNASKIKGASTYTSSSGSDVLGKPKGLVIKDYRVEVHVKEFGQKREKNSYIATWKKQGFFPMNHRHRRPFEVELRFRVKFQLANTNVLREGTCAVRFGSGPR